eukprot:6858067-Prymnesium_polylepis.2
MLTDRVHNDYASEPLARAGYASEAELARARRRLDVDLDLEHGFNSAYPSLNIGVIFFYAHALPALGALVGAFARSVESPDGTLSGWDQEPINDQVLHAGMRTSPDDRKLVRVFGGRLQLGVLPMLQFATSFTYFMLRRRAAALGARAYCVHAIFAHGKDTERKRMILRDAMAWHDPPDYYSTGR